MGTKEKCQAKCEADRDCEFFLWGQGSSGYYRCATFQACNDVVTYEDGWVKVFSKPHMQKATYEIAFEDTWCDEATHGEVFDNCCNKSFTEPCCFTNGKTTQARCEAQCNENEDCNFIVVRIDLSGCTSSIRIRIHGFSAGHAS